MIDTGTNTVVATVTVENNPSGVDTPNNAAVGNNPRGIAVTPDGKRAYAANSRLNTVSVIDTATNMGHRPGGEHSPRGRSGLKAVSPSFQRGAHGLGIALGHSLAATLAQHSAHRLVEGSIAKAD